MDGISCHGKIIIRPLKKILFIPYRENMLIDFSQGSTSAIASCNPVLYYLSALRNLVPDRKPLNSHFSTGIPVPPLLVSWHSKSCLGSKQATFLANYNFDQNMRIIIIDNLCQLNLPNPFRVPPN